MSRVVEWCMEWGKGEFGWAGVGTDVSEEVSEDL